MMPTGRAPLPYLLTPSVFSAVSQFGRDGVPCRGQGYASLADGGVQGVFYAVFDVRGRMRLGPQVRRVVRPAKLQGDEVVKFGLLRLRRP